MLGGSSVQGCVRRVMGKVMTNALMSQMSLEGKRSNKIAFGISQLCGVVKEVVLKTFPHTDLMTIITGIKNYLKNAPDRRSDKGCHDKVAMTPVRKFAEMDTDTDSSSALD